MAVRESPWTLAAWTVGVTVAAAAIAWGLYLVRQVLVLIYVSALLAIGFSPLVRLIERQQRLPIGRRIPRWLAILIVYVAILVLVAAICFVVVPPLIVQAQEFATHLPQLFARAQQWLVAHGLLRAPAKQVSVGDIVQRAPGGGTDMVGAVVLTFWTVIGGVLGLVSIVILTFYLLVDSESVFDAIVGLLPEARRARVNAVSRQVTTKVSAWLVGQLMLAGIIGTTSAVWLGLLGIPYFYVLALIAAVGELIPIVGPIFASVPGIVVALGVSWKLALVVAALYLAQQQIEANVLVPKMMERQLGLTPVTIMVALLLGAALLGIPGAILAVPTAAVLQVLLQELRAGPV